MYGVYVLESITRGKWYVGFTPAKISDRLKKHNAGLVKSTKPYIPWKVIYCEAYLERKDATGREQFLKSGSGRRYLCKQLRHYIAHNGLPRGERRDVVSSEFYAGR